MTRVKPDSVLVVDDNADMCVMLAELLALDGYKVRIAATGTEAIHLAGLERPHWILLDLCLPDMDGTAVAQAIRQLEGHTGVLVAITGRDPRDMDTSQFDHVLAKPVDVKALFQVLPPL